MATIHITKDEAERGIRALFTRVDADTSFIIEDEAGPIAVIAPPPVRELSFEERLALLESKPQPVMDEDFARDVLDGIESHREPLDASLWD